MTTLGTSQKNIKRLGILGGMGPLASAEFLKTIYEVSFYDQEQEAPICFMVSDPSLPDRTQALRNGNDQVLFDKFKEALEGLLVMGADKIVTTCVTAHYLFPRLPFHIQDKMISLVDLIIQDITTRERPGLLLTTQGSLMSGVFKAHSDWNTIESKVVIPTDGDLHQIHRLIYKIKPSGANEATIRIIQDWLTHYQVDTCIAGCTEFHLVNKYLRQNKERGLPFDIVDPLYTLAMNLKKYLNG